MDHIGRIHYTIAVMLIIFVVGGAIWYPFFKAYEKQCIDEETATEAAAE